MIKLITLDKLLVWILLLESFLPGRQVLSEGRVLTSDGLRWLSGHSETDLPAARRETLKDIRFSHKGLPMVKINMENLWTSGMEAAASHQVRVTWAPHSNPFLHSLPLPAGLWWEDLLLPLPGEQQFNIPMLTFNSGPCFWKEWRFRNPLTLHCVPENSLLWQTLIPHMTYLRRIGTPLFTYDKARHRPSKFLFLASKNVHRTACSHW